MTGSLTALLAVVLLAYPLVVYYGLSRWGLGVVAGMLMVLFLLRIVAANRSQLQELKYVAWLSGIAGITLSLLGSVFKQEGWLTFYPVIVNVLMLGLFAASLWQKQSLIERLARLKSPDLPDSGVRYTRTVTKVWCGFFVVNGSIALATCFMSLSTWTLYNGLLSYLLAGSLFAGELLVRRRVTRQSPPTKKSR